MANPLTQPPRSQVTLSLPLQAVLDLEPTPPFNFKGTLYKPSHFPSPTDDFSGGTFRFTMSLDDMNYGICLRQANSSDSLEAQVFAAQNISQDMVDRIAEELKFRFDLEADLRGFIATAQTDELLAPVERRWRGMRPSCAYSLYELICITIVLQNAQVSRSVKMLDALLRTYGLSVKFDGTVMLAFWTPIEMAAVSEEELRQLKVGYRAKTVRKVSEFFSQHPTFESNVMLLDKDAGAQELRRIFGIGPASCWYLLFEKFHHYDAFDYVSPWERKILSHLLCGVPDANAADVLSLAKERWGKWRMLAVHYLFEDLFWKHRHEPIDWLKSLIRL